MKLYVCGPMTGRSQFNIPAFDAAAADLRERGHEVVSPAELDDPEFREACLSCWKGRMDELRHHCTARGIGPDTWGDLLARDVKLIADDGIEAIVAMEAWGRSRGACLETFVGRLSGLPILSYPTLRPISEAVLGAVHARACERGAPAEIDLEDENDYAQAEQVKEEKLRDFPPLDFTPAERTIDLLEPEIVTSPPATDAVREGYEVVIERGRRLDETRTVDPETGGEKGAKEAVLGDLCPKALMQVATVAGFGRRKYARLNYLKGYDWSLSYDALQRHLHAFWAGEDTDSESGLLHLAHASWHCLGLLAFYLRGLGKDDRP